MSNFKLFVGDNTNKARYVGSLLPDQTNNAGKYLTTDGTTAIWVTLPSSETGNDQILPDQAGNAGKVLFTNGSTTYWDDLNIESSISASYDSENKRLTLL